MDAAVWWHPAGRHRAVCERAVPGVLPDFHDGVCVGPATPGVW